MRLEALARAMGALEECKEELGNALKERDHNPQNPDENREKIEELERQIAALKAMAGLP